MHKNQPNPLALLAKQSAQQEC